MPLSLYKDVSQRVNQLELPFNRFGVDPYGVSRRHLRLAMLGLGWLYRHYFRVRVHGATEVPERGRAMLVGNHAGGVALDAAVVIGSMFFEKAPPRLAQGMAEKFISRVPLLSQWTHRTGQFTGLPEHGERLLNDDRLLLVFPEGARGTAKLYKDRHSLVDFGSGFMRLAMRTKTPIVPFAFLGGGEAIPTIYNAYELGRLLGAPYVPITPYLLPLPLPVRLDIIYGEPLCFDGDGNEKDQVIFDQVDQVKHTITTLIERARQLRRGQLVNPESPEDP